MVPFLYWLQTHQNRILLILVIPLLTEAITFLLLITFKS
ncbi:hypothetical protein JCM19232_569 [Vibrio ishigakensis]|uniref:Uncharacterized protein n=1 Tax=Vibrio ishigakensis TaxID=1481914 RepID=A0A0B8P1Y6_9VIBR|nr:hypothetical protein JCM19232_569 [Vibrio ishigakensis]